MKLSIISHYYNNPYCVERMLNTFRALSERFPGSFDFILVDDHSAELIDPALFEGIENLRVFRVLEDIPWNMPGARNIAVHESLCDKVLIMDIDHLLNPDHLDLFMQEIETLPEGSKGLFSRRGLERDGTTKDMDPHVNSFLIHKSDFWKIGGYEEHLSGNYGHDDKYFLICCRHNNIKDIVFKTEFLVERGTATKTLSRDKTANTKVLEGLLAKRTFKAEKVLACTWERIH